jgi:hypothetical protein
MMPLPKQTMKRIATGVRTVSIIMKSSSISASLSAAVRVSFSRYMLIRVVAFMLLLSAGIAAGAASYSFISKASGRLGGPIRFEFYRDSSTYPKTDIESFTVSIRTADDRWKAMWSILSGHGLKQPIKYGVTPPGFTTMIQPQKLIPGRVYKGFATDGRGGSSGVTFGFDKNGGMTFPDSFDQ